MAVPVLGYEAHTWKEGLLVGHILAWAASAYCYYLVRNLPVGLPRLISCTPIFTLYAVLPLIFNRSTHLVGLASFYCILTWISSSKILLLCWSRGPGHDPWVAASFPRFAMVMTYPAHVTRHDTVVKKVAVQHSSWWNRLTKSELWYMLVARSAMKLAALAVLLELLSRRDALPLIAVHLLLSVQLYLFVTIVLEVLAAVAMAALGVTMEPHFDNPFAAASLAEFWGRRWNLLVSNMLRETVYNPLLFVLRSRGQGSERRIRVWGSGGRGFDSSRGCAGLNPEEEVHGLGLRRRSRGSASESEAELLVTSEAGLVSSVEEKERRRRFDFEKLVAMLASFLVSGLMHELLVYYATLELTWKMMSFFVVQGIAVAMEATWKLYHTNDRLPRFVVTMMTLGFAFTTAHLLFWPPLDGISEQVALEIQKMLQNLQIYRFVLEWYHFIVRKGVDCT